jgi:hypothetical protein
MYGWHVWNFTISRMACMDMYECSLRIRVAYVALNRRVKSPLGYVGASWSYGQHVAKNASAATAAGRPALQNWRRRIWMKLLLMHGCSETGARLQWNKWTCTKVAELEWSPRAQCHHMSVTNHNVSHHPSEVSEEKQRRKKRSKDRKNQVPK